jgi:hypothetical protein
VQVERKERQRKELLALREGRNRQSATPC